MDYMPAALMYRWAVFILLAVGLVLLAKHKVLTPFVFWSRVQYYTFSTFTLFVVWLGATLFRVDFPYSFPHVPPHRAAGGHPHPQAE